MTVAMALDQSGSKDAYAMQHGCNRQCHRTSRYVCLSCASKKRLGMVDEREVGWVPESRLYAFVNAESGLDDPQLEPTSRFCWKIAFMG